ncbi:hypothetical protein T12_14014 [Trichinella patagoniensis]|uniref:Uncharacterized protein n=1 Tax=Trichinella patagoniensis TaxID=990121 RepID=A0A0V0Z8P6_9BILA|nr:hypothetical protein T12_14014 [Trichinella patagoniensis]
MPALSAKHNLYEYSLSTRGFIEMSNLIEQGKIRDVELFFDLSAEETEEVKKEKLKLNRISVRSIDKLKAAIEKNLGQLYNIMEEKKNAFINASAHCGTMDGCDARCQRWIAKSVKHI